MSVPVAAELVGEVCGSVFTTGSLRFDSNPLCEMPAGSEPRCVTVVWSGERGWRLTRLYRGNQPDRLPGEDQVLAAERIREGSPKVFILVANRDSGLFSCHNWLRCGKHGLRTLSVNLMEANDAGSSPNERLSALTASLRFQVETYQKAVKRQQPSAGFDLKPLLSIDDPIEVIRRLPECGEPAPEAILMRNFDAVEIDTAERLFRRLRGLYEGTAGLPSLVLLGHSTEPLDPDENGPASSLLSLAETYTLSGLLDAEVQQMAKLLGAPWATGGARLSKIGEDVMHWSGGHPHLVQAIFYLLQSDPQVRTVEDAMRFYERERLPAFEAWVGRLRHSLRHQEVSRFMAVLLRKDRFLRGTFEHRASVLELLVQGWIRLDPEEDAWVFRSKCHRALAAEAFGQRG